MTFASPLLLLGLLLVPVALAGYVLVQRRRQKYVVRFTNVDLLSNLVPRTPGGRRHVPTALYLAAIGALAIALARPSMMLPVPREEATVMLAMDVSGSMEATDVDPSRLAAARRVGSTSVAIIERDVSIVRITVACSRGTGTTMDGRARAIASAATAARYRATGTCRRHAGRRGTRFSSRLTLVNRTT